MKEQKNSSTASRPLTKKGILRTLPGIALAIVVAVGMLVTPVIPTIAAAPPEIGFGVTVSFGPPPLPYYDQPLCPGPGYIWAPGYWAWDPSYGYYWVPGTWVPAPFVGALWTPGYWGWDADGDDYVWYPGYWGTSVGFYGGIDYGFGYNGYGYEGGRWQGRTFYYNREVNNVTNVTYVYSQPVTSRDTRVSFNGGNGGIHARPTTEQVAAARTRRSGAIEQQIRQRDAAQRMPRERASVNHGRPEIAATRQPGDFSRNAVGASRAGGHYVEPPVSHTAPRRAPENRATAPGNWRQFGSSPQRESRPPRAEVPSRVQKPVREQPHFNPPQREQAPRYQRQAPINYRPQMNRRQSPAPRVQERQAPRQERSAPPPRGHADNGHGRGNGGGGNPHGRRH